MRAFPARRPPAGAIAAIDIGSSKVCCLVAAPDGDSGLALLGFGHQRSLGLKTGVVVDGDSAERAVRAAVSQAERMAGFAIESVVLSLNGGRLASRTFTASSHIDGPVVTSADVDRVLGAGEQFIERGGRSMVQLTRSDWMVDGNPGARDPVGLAAREIGVELTAVTADDAPVRNLLAIVDRCHLCVDGLVAGPFASAIATTSAEERQSGVLAIDIGAGVTSLAFLEGGRLAWVSAIGVGGQHVTFDIARGLGTPVAEAERIKTLYGTLVKAASDATDMFSFPGAGDEEGELFQASRARLGGIVGPRLHELFGLVAARLAEAGLGGAEANRVVLTGGGSQLVGIDRAWAQRFGASARIGRPKPIGRMPANMASPAFAALVGLALGEASQIARERPGGSRAGTDLGYLGRVRRWVGDSF